MHVIRTLTVFISALYFFSPASAIGDTARPVSGFVADSGVVREEIRSRIDQLQSQIGLMVQGEEIASRQVVPALYDKFDFRPIWTNEQSVDQLLEVLQTIDEDGLDPADYHFFLLKKLRAQLDSTGQTAPQARADFDLLFTDSLVRLGYHLLIGKVDPIEFDTNWNMDRTVGNLEQVIAKVSAAITDGSIVALIQGMRPQSETYSRMRSTLVHYRSIQQEGGWQPVPEGATLRLGVSDSRVPALRERLLVTQDLKKENETGQFFDAALHDAVIRFQQRHALTADGVVGKNTLEALNRPVEEKIDQLRVNLERARWVLHDLPDKVVVVDIAGFLASVLEHQQAVFTTRTQVGTAYRMTPIFKSRITYLELNPTWTVPQTIFLEDILPKVQLDPGYLEQRELRVITWQGEMVDAANIDWSVYPDKEFPYLLRQGPGPRNALGQIKFMFPNEHAVYLHDTPSRYLFGENSRAFSSGCVRIEDPFELAELLLDEEQWTRQELMKVIESRETTQIVLKNPVTVLLLYWTVNFTKDGRAIFKRDIYERDQQVLDGLNAQFRFRERPILK